MKHLPSHYRTSVEDFGSLFGIVWATPPALSFMVNPKRLPDTMPSPRANKRRAIDAEDANQAAQLLCTSSSSWSDALLGAVFGHPAKIATPSSNLNGELPGKTNLKQALARARLASVSNCVRLNHHAQFHAHFLPRNISPNAFAIYLSGFDFVFFRWAHDHSD